MNKLMLSELASGGLQEKFNKVMDQVLENIGDPNTDPEKPREINIKLKIVPDEYREFSNVICTVTSKLVPDSDLGIKFILARDLDAKFIATEYKKQVPGQLIMETPEEEKIQNTDTVVRTLFK